MNFLSLLNSQEKIIGVSLVPGMGLEAVELDSTNGTVVNYAKRKVEYNFSSREPQNYDDLKSVLIELMDVMKIGSDLKGKTKLYFVLPNVLFDFLDIPPVLTNPEIRTSILSETEKFYLFKKEEPYFGWCEVYNPVDSTQKRVLYSAFQKNVVDNIKQIVNDIGMELCGFESAYSATLRGLFITGAVDDLILEQNPWTVMLVSTNSYSLFFLEGKNLVSYNEVPIAIRSYSQEEAYDSIVSSSSQLLSNKISSKLFIISQTDDISAEILKNHLDFDNQIEAINSNRHSKQPILDVISAEDFNAINSITYSAIGAAGHPGKREKCAVLNVLLDDPDSQSDVYFKTNIFGGEEIEVTRTLVMQVCIIATVAFLLLFGTICLGLFIYNNNQTQALEEVNSEIEQVQKKLDALAKQDNKAEIDMNSIINEIAEENVSVIKYYDSISVDIPKNVWLTKYYNKSGNQIAIKGIAQSIVDIYEYYKNVRNVSPQAEIKLNELKVISPDDLYGNNKNKDNQVSSINSLTINSNANRLYSFEISNVDMSDNQSVNGPQGQNAQQGQQGQNNAPVSDEIDIIKKTPSQAPAQGAPQQVEKTANQMVPAK